MAVCTSLEVDVRLHEPEEMIKVSREAARIIAEPLHDRLVAFYGTKWVATVNTRLQRDRKMKIDSLTDSRACLEIFGNDPATEVWAPEYLRRMARKLRSLASSAHHDKPPTDKAIEQAQSILWAFTNHFSPSRMLGASTISSTFEKSNTPALPQNVLYQGPTVYSYRSKVHDPTRKAHLRPGMQREAVYVARALHLTGSGWDFLPLLKRFASTFENQGTRYPSPMLRLTRSVLFPPVARIVPEQRVESFLENANIYELDEAIRELESRLRQDPDWGQPKQAQFSRNESPWHENRWPMWLIRLLRS